MLKAQDFRNRAWAALNGKWGTMALCALIYELILGSCAGLSYFYVGGVGVLLLTGPLTLGMALLSLAVIRAQEVKVEKLFDGFKNFVNSFVLYIINTVFIALWSLLLVVPGIIKALSYGMSYYILADNPDMSPNDARKQSMVMMNGNKWRLFCLQFSFIGWWILCVFTLGILSFWITPYANAATAAFYQSLLAEQRAPYVSEPPAQNEFANTQENPAEYPADNQAE